MPREARLQVCKRRLQTVQWDEHPRLVLKRMVVMRADEAASVLVQILASSLQVRYLHLPTILPVSLALDLDLGRRSSYPPAPRGLDRDDDAGDSMPPVLNAQLKSILRQRSHGLPP